MDSQDAKRKRPVTCLESGATYDSAYRAAKELGFADSRNIFRSIQRGTCTQGLHFYYADEPKPAPEFFIPPNRPPRPVVCLDTGEMFESAFQAGRAFGIAAGGVRTSASTGVERNGHHFYYGDEPKPAPEFFKPAKGKGGKSPAEVAAAAKNAAAKGAAGTDGRKYGIQRDRRAVQ